MKGTTYAFRLQLVEIVTDEEGTKSYHVARQRVHPVPFCLYKKDQSELYEELRAIVCDMFDEIGGGFPAYFSNLIKELEVRGE
jgi:hypothetical protein